jgi:hypothetical protein
MILNSGKSTVLVFIIVLALIVLAGYFLFGPGNDIKGESVDFSDKILGLDLIDSPLGQIKVPDLDINVPLDFGNISPNIPDVSVEGRININAPDIELR